MAAAMNNAGNEMTTPIAQGPDENVEQDAARYRWLRDRMEVLYKETMSGREPRATLAMRIGHEFLDSKMRPAAGWMATLYFDECREKVDAAIDDAMKMANNQAKCPGCSFPGPA